MARLRSHAPLIIAVAGTLGALVLLWLTRRQTLAMPPVFYFDAPGAFFALLAWGGSALLLLVRKPVQQPAWRMLGAALFLTCAFVTALTPLVIVAYLAMTLLMTGTTGRWRTRAALRRVTPLILAVAALALGYGALALRGALRIDAPQAGAALDSFVFWFVLLATSTPLMPLTATRPDIAVSRGAATHVLTFAWLYPLVRLYTLGPWNEGWSFATLVLGGGAMVWMSLTAFTARDHVVRSGYARHRFLAVALAGTGLSSGAGLAATGYALLVYVLLAVTDAGQAGTDPVAEQDDSVSFLPSTLPTWLLSGAIPLTAPFIATWMLVGAAAAGGISLLAAAAWFTALLAALSIVLEPPCAMSRTWWFAGVASLALGIAAPLVVRILIQPSIEQLQGGLSVYGDVNVWPWVGLATGDSARTGVTALPTIGAAGLMLVLSAMVYLLVRLLQPPVSTGPASGVPARENVLDELRRTVPWLGGDTARAPDHDDR